MLHTPENIALTIKATFSSKSYDEVIRILDCASYKVANSPWEKICTNIFIGKCLKTVQANVPRSYKMYVRHKTDILTILQGLFTKTDPMPKSSTITEPVSVDNITVIEDMDLPKNIAINDCDRNSADIQHADVIVQTDDYEFHNCNSDIENNLGLSIEIENMSDEYKAHSDDIEDGSSGKQSECEIRNTNNGIIDSLINEEFQIDEQFWEKFWTGQRTLTKGWTHEFNEYFEKKISSLCFKNKLSSL